MTYQNKMTVLWDGRYENLVRLSTSSSPASLWIMHGKSIFSLQGDSAASWIWSVILSCVPREERSRRRYHPGNLCQRHHCVWGQESHKDCQFKIPVAWNRENFSSCELESSETLLHSATLLPLLSITLINLLHSEPELGSFCTSKCKTRLDLDANTKMSSS